MSSSNVKICYRTRQEDAVLVLSTFLGQPSGNLGHFYSVSVLDGKLLVLFGHSNQITRYMMAKYT